jgi:hypothetical protein
MFVDSWAITVSSDNNVLQHLFESHLTHHCEIGEGVIASHCLSSFVLRVPVFTVCPFPSITGDIP